MHMLYFTMKRCNLILMASCSCTIQQQNDPQPRALALHNHQAIHTTE